MRMLGNRHQQSVAGQAQRQPERGAGKSRNIVPGQRRQIGAMRTALGRPLAEATSLPRPSDQSFETGARSVSGESHAHAGLE
jgi:hypothetical protein